ncbi:putative NADPH-dependent quinone reductase tdiC [Ceratocystis lukuohia]|uniref:NADPH-dependent quinone reductase tdiC n=1 Tax=Ceratocystis lukuohia TaxID=2019550 RepID=A0ABR4MCV9_9PEZI
MLEITVDDWSAGPKVVESPPPGPPSSSEIQVTLLATGLHQLVRSRASGRHYSSGSLPHRPGIDGVGIDTATGKHVYFSTLVSGHGSFAHTLNIPKNHAVLLPVDVDPCQAAALMNPVMGTWMALTQRVDLDELRQRQPHGWSVLILGATSASGRMAVRVARALGAKKVVGAARSEKGLKAVPGLDAHVILNAEKPSATDFAQARGVDVVLDYVYGPYAEAYLRQLKTDTKLVYINIGALAGAEAAVPSSALRSNQVEIKGAGLGSWNLEKLMPEVEGMLSVLKGVKEELTVVKLQNVEAGWAAKGRVVFIV